MLISLVQYYNLQAAAYRGNIEVIRLLLDKGADVNTRSGKYGAALEKMLAVVEPVGAGQKVPSDIPLLAELIQGHVPIPLPPTRCRPS